MSDQLERLQAALTGRYAIERELGRGGMAVVYLARDLRHERHVAIKVMGHDLSAQLGTERFVREIKTAAQLTHPNILPLPPARGTGHRARAGGSGPDRQRRGGV